jgi:hypothetical protein
MPLFRKKDHTAEDEAGRVQFERLMALSPADLAAELMRAFGPDGPRRGKDLSSVKLVQWLLRGVRGVGGVSHPGIKLDAAVQEAMQVLEHAELVRGIQLRDVGRRWNATRLGEVAVAGGDVRQHIKDRTGL